jgi:hypothetical protein
MVDLLAAICKGFLCQDPIPDVDLLNGEEG